MMLLEALLDSNNRYLPIKIAFPRFIIVLGSLCINLGHYVQRGGNKDHLNFLLCSFYARLNFLCAAISFRLMRDAAKREFYDFAEYVIGILVLFTELVLRQWSSYYDRNKSFVFAQNCLTAVTLVMIFYILVRVVQHYFSRVNSDDFQHRGRYYYDYMSHLTICVLILGSSMIKMSFGFQSLKYVTANEIVAHHCVGLFATVMFFFTSSYIAQQHFVKAEVRIAAVLYCCIAVFLFDFDFDLVHRRLVYIFNASYFCFF